MNNKTTLYSNIIVNHFFVPFIFMIAVAASALYCVSHLCGFFMENLWNNHLWRWMMLIYLPALQVPLLFNRTYAALQRHDATFHITARSWRFMQVMSASIYMMLLYMILRSIHSPIKSVVYAIVLYGVLIFVPRIFRFLQK